MKSSGAARAQARGGADLAKPRVAAVPADDHLEAGVDVSLWVRLLQSHNLMLAEARRKLSPHCTMPRLDLMANLDREDGQSLATLSRKMLVTAGNLTGLVTRAERDGDVVRRADKNDGRLWRIFLTPKGRKLIDSLIPIHRTQVAELVGHLSLRERQDLRRLLGKLRSGLVVERNG